MSVTVHNKLVRDKIPAIITANGDTAVTRVLGHKDYLEALYEKMGEELAELSAASLDERAGELADVHEVFTALMHARSAHRCPPTWS